MRKGLALAIVLALCATTVLAGWMRQNGKTYFVSGQSTCATFWNRNDTQDILYPADEILIYPDTLQYMTASNTVRYATGYWEMVNTGVIIPAIVDLSLYVHRKDAGEWAGAQWELNSLGYIIPKD